MLRKLKIGKLSKCDQSAHAEGKTAMFEVLSNSTKPGLMGLDYWI